MEEPKELAHEHEYQPLPEQLPAYLNIIPLVDELVEKHGFGPRSMYVEMCWLPVLGPTATWLYRRLGSWAEHYPSSLKVDMTDLSVSLGLGEGLGLNSKLGKALNRLNHFGAVAWRGEELAVRRALAPLPQRHVERLSYTAFRAHLNYLNHIERGDPAVWTG